MSSELAGVSVCSPPRGQQAGRKVCSAAPVGVWGLAVPSARPWLAEEGWDHVYISHVWPGPGTVPPRDFHQSAALVCVVVWSEAL